MNASDNIDSERDDDVLAAEYVLGALPADARAHALRRIETDPDFARLVDHWEARLSTLSDGYEAVAPPPRLKTQIDRTLFQTTRKPRLRSAGPLAFLGGTLTGAALASALLAWVAVTGRLPQSLRPPPLKPAPQLVTLLDGQGGQAQYFALFDPARRQIVLHRVKSTHAANRDFELWVIAGDGKPRSLGIIPDGETLTLAPDGGRHAGIERNATFAISVEPKGGSPTGQPTGPVVATGRLKEI